MKPKHQRLTLITLGLCAFSLMVFFVLNALNEHMLYFYMPAELKTASLKQGQKVRLGGLVKEGTVKKEGLSVTFIVTDTQEDLKVTYTGILPDLFREGQGVIAEGYLKEATFQAKTILAKHDENYMPPEVAKALKEKGVYQGS